MRDRARELPRPLLLGLLAGILLSGCGEKPSERTEALLVRYRTAEPLAAGKETSAPAYIAVVRGDRETDLSFKVGGILEVIGRGGTGVDWEEGAIAEPGEVLAQLKQADFISATNAASAKATLDKKQLERAEQLIKDGAISQQEFDSIRAAQISSAANLAQRLQDLQDSTLVAPFRGALLARLVNSGQTIPAGQPVLRFGGLDPMSVEVGVPDKMVGHVKVGDEIELEITALERKIKGRVSEVGVAARDGGRLFRVVIKVSNADRAIKSGMMASVALPGGPVAASNAVLVPLSALVARPGGELTVFVVGADLVARQRPVKTDDIRGSAIIITEGLARGEKVVTIGASRLFDGARVEVRAAEAP